MANFEFLCSMGFKQVTEDETLVRYESDVVFVNVYHGRTSFDIGVEIGRLGRPDKYGLDSIILEAGRDAWKAEGFDRSPMFQVSKKEGVQNIVSKVALLVEKYGRPFLQGDAAFYAQLEKANETSAR